MNDQLFDSPAPPTAADKLTKQTDRTAPRKGRRRFDVLVMVLMVYFLAGNPIVSVAGFRVTTSIASVILLILVFISGLRFTVRQVLVAAGFFGVIALQAIFATDSFSWFTTIGFATRLAVALTAAMIVHDFPTTYVDVMYWSALTSFPFYAALVVTRGAVASWVSSFSLHVPDPSIFLYYFAVIHHGRNNSYFWEPGVFSGYLILALLFLGARRTHYSPQQYRRIFFVLFVALITTKSTGGYLSVPLAMLYHGKALGRNLALRLLIVAVAIIGVGYLFSKAEFLGSKIQGQFEAVEGQRGSWQATRYGALVSDARLIKIHPLIGWGPDTSIKYLFAPEKAVRGEGNGLSTFTVQFGFIGLAIFLISSWDAFRGLFGRGGWPPLVAVLAIVLVLNDEAFLGFPLFMALMFLQNRARQPAAQTAVQQIALRPRLSTGEAPA